MSDDSVRIDITRNNSKHLSCRQLRERIEEEMEDTNTITANAKRELDAKYALISCLIYPSRGISGLYLNRIKMIHKHDLIYTIISIVILDTMVFII